MTNFPIPPHLPDKLTMESISEAIALSLSELQYGRPISGPTCFAKELAESIKLRTVPPGWLENHHVLLPEEISLTSEEEIFERLERMVNTVRDPKAIKAILCSVAIPRDDAKGRTEYFNPIRDLLGLARRLTDAQTKDSKFVNCLLRGYLGECALALANGTIKIGATTARTLLIDLSILWGLHDLQIIACRLYQDTMRPTAGWLEGQAFRPKTLDTLNQVALTLLPHIGTLLPLLASGHDGVKDDPEFVEQMQSLEGYGHAHGLIEPLKDLAKQFGLTEDQISGDDPTLPDDMLEVFSKSTDAAYSAAQSLVGKSEGQYSRRTDEEGESSDAKRLQAGSFRDGMRAEASLAHAVITFVYMINDIPRRIDRFIENPDEDALACRTLTPCKFSQIKCDVEALVDVMRAIYLQDSNHLREDGPGANLHSGGEKLTLEQVRELLIARQSDRLLEYPIFRTPPLSRKSLKPGAAREAIGDARRVLEKERALPLDDGDKKFQALPADPKLSPALAWRFSCTQANIPTPDLTRPSIPQI